MNSASNLNPVAALSPLAIFCSHSQKKGGTEHPADESPPNLGYLTVAGAFTTKSALRKRVAKPNPDLEQIPSPVLVWRPRASQLRAG